MRRVSVLPVLLSSGPPIERARRRKGVDLLQHDDGGLDVHLASLIARLEEDDFEVVQSVAELRRFAAEMKQASVVPGTSFRTLGQKSTDAPHTMRENATKASTPRQSCRTAQGRRPTSGLRSAKEQSRTRDRPDHNHARA